MRTAIVLTFLVMALTAGCAGSRTPEQPTPRFQEWVQLYTDSSTCEDSALNLTRNEPQDLLRYTGPRPDHYLWTYYHLYCATPELPPTRTFNEWLGWKTSTLQCEDPRDELVLETAQWTWPYEASFSCMSPTPIPQPTSTPRPTSTPWPTSAPWTAPTRQLPWTPPATPTMQQMAEWGPETRYAWDQCWRARGEFEIGNIRQGPDGNWTWQYRCNPPPEPEQRRRTEGIPLDDLIACGAGIAGLFVGEWISIIGCLGLLDN